MPRRPLPPGAHGNITVREDRPGLHIARCWYRDLNGEMRRPSARGVSETDAIYNLQQQLTEMTARIVQGELTRDDRFQKGADLWLAEREVDVVNGVLGAGSLRTYKSMLNNHVLPRLKALRWRECKVRVFDALLRDKRTELGYDSAALIRTICGGICDLAVRHEALDDNPIRSVKRLVRAAKDRKEVVALADEQIGAMLDELREYAEKKTRDSKGRRVGRRALVWTDLPELAEGMLATGARIGEALALTGPDIELDVAGRYRLPGEELDPSKPFVYVTVDAHIIRITGEGLVRVKGLKGPAGGRPGSTSRQPTWSNGMWLRRKMAAGEGPIYASIEGGFLDPSNTGNRLREALDATGYEWVTSHVWRKTVNRLLDESGMTASERGDHLNNSEEVNSKRYRSKRKVNLRGAAALEGVRTRAR